MKIQEKDLRIKLIEKIVKLWHETQIGNIHTCREKQFEFADMMWELYNDTQNKE